jgi:hypothetical protein
MTEGTFRVNKRLAAMAGVLHSVGRMFIEQARDAHITATVLGLKADGSTTFVHFRCPGEEIDEKREALFRDDIGTRFIAAVFICEAWSVSKDTDEAPANVRTEPTRLEVVVFDGRDDRGNQLRARALINRDEGPGLLPLQYMLPGNFRYEPSITEHAE